MLPKIFYIFLDILYLYFTYFYHFITKENIIQELFVKLLNIFLLFLFFLTCFLFGDQISYSCKAQMSEQLVFVQSQKHGVNTF